MPLRACWRPSSPASPLPKGLRALLRPWRALARSWSRPRLGSACARRVPARLPGAALRPPWLGLPSSVPGLGTAPRLQCPSSGL
eukprot:2310310-Alexandrium_andersonii.AAC.1